MARFRALLLAIGTMLFAACGGTGPADPGPGPLAGLADAVGPPPLGPHAASDTSTIDGDDFDVPGPGVTVQTPTITVDAAGLSCSWVRYVYGLEPGATLTGLQITVQDVVTEYWVALPDYAAGTWRWHGPYHDDAAPVPATGWGDCISPTDNLYWLVAAASGHSLRVLGSYVDYEPAAEIIFFVPPEGQHTASPGPATNPQLVLMPEIPNLAEEGAPVIFFTADDGGDQNTFIAYYDGSAWSQRLLAPDGPRITWPIARWNGDEGLIVAYDHEAGPPGPDPKGMVSVIKTDNRWSITSSEYITAPMGRPLTHLAMDYYAPDDQLGIIHAYVDQGAGPQLDASMVTPDAGYYLSDLVLGDTIAGVDVAVDSAGSWMAVYSSGTVDTSEDLDLSFIVKVGHSSGSNWSFSNGDITDYNEPLSLALGYAPDDTPQLLMVSGRNFELSIPPFIDITATLYYDVVMGTWLGNTWEYNPLFESTLEINILQSTADVDLGADISWAGNGAFSMSHVDGTIEVDLSGGFEITGGTLTNHSEYWMKLGGGFGITDIFTGDAGALFDWEENPSGSFSCAYIKAESVDIEEILGGNLESAGELLYWSPDS